MKSGVGRNRGSSPPAPTSSPLPPAPPRTPTPPSPTPRSLRPPPRAGGLVSPHPSWTGSPASAAHAAHLPGGLEPSTCPSPSRSPPHFRPEDPLLSPPLGTLLEEVLPGLYRVFAPPALWGALLRAVAVVHQVVAGAHGPRRWKRDGSRVRRQPTRHPLPDGRRFADTDQERSSLGEYPRFNSVNGWTVHE